MAVSGAAPAFGAPLRPAPTAIPGLVVWQLTVHGDARGWFKENWQREAMMAAGLPDFGPVQNNVAFNDAVGVTRGIHAEPWDKWVSLTSGRIFGAWVDLRRGPTFGTVVTAELDPSQAVFVPRGVGNAYQTLEPDTAYTYLVNDHWSPDAGYTFLNLADEAAAISWPIPLGDAVVSAKDLAHPRLSEVIPIPPRRTLVLGANGQLGRALRAEFDATGSGADVEYAGRAELDLSDPGLAGARRWRDYGAVINAAAHTAVDAAETAAGRRAAWSVNAAGVARLARIATEHRITLVHVSTDYVFDGTAGPYAEDDPVCPLGVYGQTKAAGEAAVSTVPRHYLVRTSWVVGDGRNFVRTMAALAERGASPRVVDDQWGRPTFAAELARAIRHLVDSGAPYGTYHVTSSGEPASWFELARRVFALVGADPEQVSPVSAAEYAAGSSSAAGPGGSGAGGAVGPVAPRPASSVLDLTKIISTGFTPGDWVDGLAEYLRR